MNSRVSEIKVNIFAIRADLCIQFYHHHHHVPEGLGVFPVP